MKLAIINDGRGTTRVHAADCADVKREVKKFRNGDAYLGDFNSRKDVNEDWWGDVATDQFEYGTPEWEKECADSAAAATVYLPCCSALPDIPEAPKATAYRSLRTKTIHTHKCPAVTAMLVKASNGILPKPWAAYDPDLAEQDLAEHPEWDCSRCERIRRSEQTVARLEEKAEPQGYFSAAAKVAHTAQCPSMKAAASGKLHIPLMKTGFRALSALLKMIDAGEAKECRSCAKIRGHQH